ncbi:MAG: hypothetical protein SCH98_05615 [Deferrisomatales bacterium]|nr:hypothetical protein [Deferrisomatales bacterium]
MEDSELGQETLLFVYNADASLLAGIVDFLTKVFAPKRYPCRLCLLTYGVLRMKRQWREFLERLPQRKVFLHRDDFRRNHPDLAGSPLPAVLRITGRGSSVLLSAQEIHHVENLEALEHRLLERLGMAGMPGN